MHQYVIDQRSKAALQMLQVGDAPGDTSVRIGQSAEKRTRVRRAPQRPLVEVQQSHITTVATQRRKDGGKTS